MEKEQLLQSLMEYTNRETKLSDLVQDLEINEYEVLGLVKELRNIGINISVKVHDDDIYLFNQGEREQDIENTYKFNTNDCHEFKFIAISDTLIGSKYQQLSLLNDIYQKGYEMGYNNVIFCGNLTAGLYSVTNTYADSCFLDDTMRQVDYIIESYPQVEGMKTYFITGPTDEKHLKKNKINIGKRISESRKDLVYLGFNSCMVEIDKAKMFVSCSKLGKTYTVSYRSQQQIDSFRSEDKPDIFLLGGLLQMEKYTYRDVTAISVPSVCATTKEMTEKRYQNTIGAWYITVKTSAKGYLESIRALDSVYYVTNKNDYVKTRVLKINGGK